MGGDISGRKILEIVSQSSEKQFADKKRKTQILPFAAWLNNANVLLCVNMVIGVLISENWLSFDYEYGLR